LHGSSDNPYPCPYRGSAYELLRVLLNECYTLDTTSTIIDTVCGAATSDWALSLLILAGVVKVSSGCIGCALSCILDTVMATLLHAAAV
jgi:hypothetical protein